MRIRIFTDAIKEMETKREFLSLIDYYTTNTLLYVEFSKRL